jgi:hypothetical protein
MAERASSVASLPDSLDFCGMFAISVVASSLRRTELTARAACWGGPGRERLIVRGRFAAAIRPA